MLDGYEPELVRAMHGAKASVFECDSWDVFSTEPVELGGNVTTTAIGGEKSAMGSWGSWMNTELFLRTWNKVVQDGRYWQNDWSIKADPDCVFFPERLRWHLRKVQPGGSNGTSLYIKNCPRKFGLLGSLEVFNREAVRTFGRNAQNCTEKCGAKFSGEDGFMAACMALLGVGSMSDFDLLVDNFCGFGTCANNYWNVAFHPYKDISAWFKCKWEVDHSSLVPG